MRFTCSVEVNLPIGRVVDLWQDPGNLTKWQDGFISQEHLSGVPGEAGSKSRMIYQIGKRRIELIETIITNDLPDWFIGSYHTDAMTNTMINHFVGVDDNLTRWDAEIEYTRFNALGPRVMSWLMPGMFRKKTQKWLDQFRGFAEDQPSDSRA